MSNKTTNESFPSIQKTKTIKNTRILKDLWKNPRNENFEESYSEYYPPDLWFIGKSREFEKEIAKSIRNATDIVIICSFLLQETEIIKAALSVASKARVYVLTASENRLKDANKSEEGLEEERINDHLQLLQKLKKKCLIRTAGNIHAKFVLVDPKIPEKRQGVLSTANLTQHALKNNVELGVGLNDSQIIDLFNLFCSVFWYGSEHELLTKDQLQATKEMLTSEVHKNPPLSEVFTPNSSLDFKTQLIDAISTKDGDIYLSTYSIKADNEVHKLLINELENRPSRKITIFIRPRSRMLPIISKLSSKGANIIGHSLLHMKVLMIKNPEKTRGLAFTGNITHQSLNESFDIGIFLSSHQADQILSTLELWKTKYMMKFIGDKNIQDLENGQKYHQWDPKHRDTRMQEISLKDLGDIEGESIDNYIEIQPELEISDDLAMNTKKIKFRWRNTPPRLPKNVCPLWSKTDKPGKFPWARPTLLPTSKQS